MNIGVIGSGGREHAIIWKLQQSKSVKKVYAISGNGGTENILNLKHFDDIYQACKEHQISYLIVGPEVPLEDGMVDFFRKTDIKIFGPEKRAAKLESSKIYAKQFMKKYGVSTADFWEFHSSKEAESKIRELQGNLVIKYDGLAAGKGVFVCSNKQEAEEALQKLSERYGEEVDFLIEEKLTGQELSIIGITDGKCIKTLLPSQDHKQLLDDDKGPNTGGMGAFCPVPFVDAEMLKNIDEQIIQPTLDGIKQENFDYKGVLYFGIMVTEQGPKLLEYNVRFGDPETEVVLPALRSDLYEIIEAALNGNLAEMELEFEDGYFVDVVLAAGGYPFEYQKHKEITGLENVKEGWIFHAGTKKNGDKIFTNGGRVLNVVQTGITLDEAIEKTYENVKKIRFENMYFRTDIGKRKVKSKK
jgi:phosphoribosylamine--glycine ligase